jgi:hypothetical protein
MDENTMKALLAARKLALPLTFATLAPLLAAACAGLDDPTQQSAAMTEQCIPECAHVGTKKEGWYCGTERRGPLTACDGCDAYCGAIGSRSEGWYNSCDDTLIGWASCADLQPAPSCLPTCDQVGTAQEGWYCGGELRGPAKACDGCVAYCGAIGSKSEGWYSSCGGLIGWDQCSGREMAPTCMPSCIDLGGGESAWYCDGQLVGPSGDCTGCTAECHAIGSKSEGWYSSCGGLIGWADCG